MAMCLRVCVYVRIYEFICVRLTPHHRYVYKDFARFSIYLVPQGSVGKSPFSLHKLNPLMELNNETGGLVSISVCFVSLKLDREHNTKMKLSAYIQSLKIEAW